MPALRAVGTFAFANSGAVSPSIPAGIAANDILLCRVGTGGNPTITMPAGWTRKGSPLQNGTANQLTVWWKRTTGSETAPSVGGATQDVLAVICAYSGCITTGDPFDVFGTAGTGNTSPATAPSITTHADGALVLFDSAWTTTGAGNAVYGTPSGTTPTFTLGDQVGLSGNTVDVTLMTSDGTLTTAGATGSVTSTLTQPDNWVAVMSALLPPGGAVTASQAKDISQLGPGVTPNKRAQFVGQIVNFGQTSTGLTLSLTGVQAVAAAGAISPSATISLTGVTAVTATGNLNVVPPSSLGFLRTSGPGGQGPFNNFQFVPDPRSNLLIPSPDVTLQLTGVLGSTAPGTLVPNATVPTIGNAVTAAVGTLSPATIPVLSGNNAATAPGTLAPSNTVPVIGNAASGAPGTVTAQTGPVLTSVSASSALGTVVASTAITLAGNAAVGTAGTVVVFTPDVTVALTGIIAITNVGRLIAVGGDVFVPTGAGAVGGGGSSHRGSNTKEILRLRKKDEEFTDELRSIYRGIIKRGQPELVQKAQKIVQAATPQIDAPAVSIAELPAEKRDEEIQKLTTLHTDLEIALRLIKEELDIEEENKRVIDIIMQVI